MITVTKVQLRKQVAEGSASSEDAEHLIWVDDGMAVLTEDGPRLPAQTLWFLDHGTWVDDLYVTCKTPGCIRIEHLTDSKAQADAVKDAEDLALVQRHAVTLADLYRKGRAKGLVFRTSHYGK